MIENPAVMILSKPSEINNNYGDGVKTICFELDIFGKPVHLGISVAQKQARLSDITPLARTLSTKLAIMALDRLRGKGEFIPCCKGCSSCCNYLIPLSIPEAFRLREEILALPAEQGRAVFQSCLETAKIILDDKPKEFEITESTETNSQMQINQLSKWYASLKLACPFLSDSLCTSYEQRPIACREYIVTGSSLLCEDECSDESLSVQMPVSVLDCLGQLAAELEQSDIEAVMLPLAMPWVQENLERNERTWPAVTMVECFVEILQALNIEQSKAPTTKKAQFCS
jgi:Fe-S-cluster containining protein